MIFGWLKNDNFLLKVDDCLLKIDDFIITMQWLTEFSCRLVEQFSIFSMKSMISGLFYPSFLVGFD